jgi:hypothetical protein
MALFLGLPPFDSEKFGECLLAWAYHPKFTQTIAIPFFFEQQQQQPQNPSNNNNNDDLDTSVNPDDSMQSGNVRGIFESAGAAATAPTGNEKNNKLEKPPSSSKRAARAYEVFYQGAIKDVLTQHFSYLRQNSQFTAMVYSLVDTILVQNHSSCDFDSTTAQMMIPKRMFEMFFHTWWQDVFPKTPFCKGVKFLGWDHLPGGAQKQQQQQKNTSENKQQQTNVVVDEGDNILLGGDEVDTKEVRKSASGTLALSSLLGSKVQKTISKSMWKLASKIEPPTTSKNTPPSDNNNNNHTTVVGHRSSSQSVPGRSSNLSNNNKLDSGSLNAPSSGSLPNTTTSSSPSPISSPSSPTSSSSLKRISRSTFVEVLVYLIECWSMLSVLVPPANSISSSSSSSIPSTTTWSLQFPCLIPETYYLILNEMLQSLVHEVGGKQHNQGLNNGADMTNKRDDDDERQQHVDCIFENVFMLPAGSASERKVLQQQQQQQQSADPMQGYYLQEFQQQQQQQQQQHQYYYNHEDDDYENLILGNNNNNLNNNQRGEDQIGAERVFYNVITGQSNLTGIDLGGGGVNNNGNTNITTSFLGTTTTLDDEESLQIVAGVTATMFANTHLRVTDSFPAVEGSNVNLGQAFAQSGEGTSLVRSPQQMLNNRVTGYPRRQNQNPFSLTGMTSASQNANPFHHHNAVAASSRPGMTDSSAVSTDFVAAGRGGVGGGAVFTSSLGGDDQSALRIFANRNLLRSIPHHNLGDNEMEGYQDY